MNSIVFVPIKKNSTRVPGKNLRPLDGRPLYQHSLNKLKDVGFDTIVVDTDSEEIINWCSKENIIAIKREPWYASDEANGNDLLIHHASLFPAFDLYFQAFVTAPFLTVETISNCLEFLKYSTACDSVFTAQKHPGWFWMDGNPVNYQPSLLPRSQDAKFLIQETTGLYGITKKALKKYNQRIGATPKMWLVSWLEALDIDTEEDFEFAEKLCQIVE